MCGRETLIGYATFCQCVIHVSSSDPASFPSVTALIEVTKLAYEGLGPKSIVSAKRVTSHLTARQERLGTRQSLTIHIYSAGFWMPETGTAGVYVGLGFCW